MREEQTSAPSPEHWCLFHGTSAELASRIVREGSLPYLRSIGAEHLGVELWPRLLRRYGDVNGVVSRLTEGGCQFSVSAAAALANLSGKMPAKNFEYGDFYATFGPLRAARYALRAGYGSELLGILADVINTLKSDGEDLDELLNGVPELAALTAKASSPVMLEISGLSLDNLADENGIELGPQVALKLWKHLQLLESLNGVSNAGTSLDVRLREVIPRHIRWVYLLDLLAPACVSAILNVSSEDDHDLLLAIQRCRCSVEEFSAA